MLPDDITIGNKISLSPSLWIIVWPLSLSNSFLYDEGSGINGETLVDLNLVRKSVDQIVETHIVTLIMIVSTVQFGTSFFDILNYALFMRLTNN